MRGCAQTRRLLEAYADGILPAETRQSVEAHTGSCLECHGLLALSGLVQREMRPAVKLALGKPATMSRAQAYALYDRVVAQAARPGMLQLGKTGLAVATLLMMLVATALVAGLLYKLATDQIVPVPVDGTATATPAAPPTSTPMPTAFAWETPPARPTGTGPVLVPPVPPQLTVVQPTPSADGDRQFPQSTVVPSRRTSIPSKTRSATGPGPFTTAVSGSVTAPGTPGSNQPHTREPEPTATTRVVGVPTEPSGPTDTPRLPEPQETATPVPAWTLTPQPVAGEPEPTYTFTPTPESPGVPTPPYGPTYTPLPRPTSTIIPTPVPIPSFTPSPTEAPSSTRAPEPTTTCTPIPLPTGTPTVVPSATWPPPPIHTPGQTCTPGLMRTPRPTGTGTPPPWPWPTWTPHGSQTPDPWPTRQRMWPTSTLGPK